jgi:stage III sporulation protein AH
MMVLNFKDLKRPRIWVAILVILGIVFTFSHIRPSTFFANFAKKDYNRALSVTRPVTVTQQEQAVVAPVVALDFFVEYRMERDRLRSERIDLLREVAKNSKNEDSPRQKAQDTIMKITLDRQKEMEMENLIKSRGFADALVFIRENSVNAIVKTNTLSKEEVIQIADIISKSIGVRQEDITISAKQ